MAFGDRASHAAQGPTAIAYIRALSLQGYREWIERQGGDIAALLGEAGLPQTDLNDLDLHLPFRDVAAFLELLATRLKRPNASLDYARDLPNHFRGVGPMMLLTHKTETIDAWLRECRACWFAHTNAFNMTLEDSDGRARLRMKPMTIALPGRQLGEALLSQIWQMIRHAADDKALTPRVVHFQHAAPEDAASHRDLFGCPVKFEQAHTELIFSRDILDRAVTTDEALRRSLIDAYTRCRMTQTTAFDGTIAATTALTIASVLGTGLSGIDAIADALAMHPKRLQRFLGDEGTTFSNVLEQVREAQARRFLAETDMAIEHVASLLDYSSTAAFSTAFRRWTGQTPREFRRGR